MEHIGTKIKELRKKKDMTQEKLADCLNVSFQAVSKWETGVSAPDLSQLIPLAKLFDVTTDELLGYTKEKSDRRKELEAAYKAACLIDDVNKKYQIAREATAEYPGELTYIEWLASAEYSLAFSENLAAGASAEYFGEMIDNALRRFEYIIDHCTDPHLLQRAVLCKIMCLRFTERIEEADWSAEFEYPDEKTVTTNDALMLFDEGRKLLDYLKEQEKQLQSQRIYNKLARDKIPDIIKAKGEVPITRILDDSEYKAALEKKLEEECKEVLAAKGSERIEELADMIEVIRYLAKAENTALDDVIAAAEEKSRKKGAFENKIFLEKVIKTVDN